MQALPGYMVAGGIEVKQFAGEKFDWLPDYKKDYDGTISEMSFEEIALAAEGLKSLVEASPLRKHHAEHDRLLSVGIFARFICAEPTLDNKSYDIVKQPFHRTLSASSRNLVHFGGEVFLHTEQRQPLSKERVEIILGQMIMVNQSIWETTQLQSIDNGETTESAKPSKITAFFNRFTAH